MVIKKSEKFKQARTGLPDELKPIYDDLVTQYAFHTTRLFGRGYVAYEVLASLVRDGWRCSEKPNKV
ncbi:MAG: hypothetical protein ACYS30_12175 [Planctomycetota bacterium]|jgi:hypothetical protein